MRFLVVAALLLAGCANKIEVIQYKNAAEAYADVTDVVSFWEREGYLASVRNTQALAKSPASYRRCVAEQMAVHSSPQSIRLIQQFIANKTDANYDLIAVDRTDLVFDGKAVPIDEGVKRIVDYCS